MELSLVGSRQMEDDLLVCNCIHHLIIQEYLKRKTDFFGLELNSFKMFRGNQSKTEALCSQSVGIQELSLDQRTRDRKSGPRSRGHD